MKEELIKLYEEYLANSIEERTHELTDLEDGGMKKVEFKGDLDGFIWYLKDSLTPLSER